MNTSETIHRALSFLLTICVAGYVALSYPQIGTSLKDALLIGAFVLMILLWFADRQTFREYIQRLIRDPVAWGVALLFLWGLIAALVTGMQNHDTVRDLDVFRKIMIKGGMAFLIITYFCHRTKSTWLIFTVMALVGAAACLDTIASYGLGYFSFTNRDAVRTLLHERIHVNLISLRLNFVAPFFVAWSWVLASRHGSRWRWPVYAATVFVLIASFLTISRAGWLGAVGGLFVLFLFARARKVLLTSIVIFLLVFSLAYAGSKDIRMHVATLKERLPTISERLPNWELCVRAISARPIWGWEVFGVETFHRMVRVMDGDNSKILKYLHPHNIFLELSLLWGLPFLVIFLAIFSYIYWKGWIDSGVLDIRLRLQWAAIAGATVGAFWINGLFSEVIWPNVFIAVGLASSLLASTGNDAKENGKSV